MDRDRLAQEARRYVDESKIPWGEAPGRVELDEMRLNQLRALGYVVGQ